MRTVAAMLAARPGRLAATVLLAAGMVLAGVGLLATSGYLVARAAQHPDTVLALMVAVTGVRFFGLARAALRYLERLLSHDLTLRLLLALRRRSYARLLPLAPLELGGERSAELVGRLVEDVDELQTVALRIVIPVLSALLVVLASVGLIALASVAAAAAALALLLAGGVALPLALRAWGDRLGRRRAHLRSRHRVTFHDAVRGAQELWVFGRDDAYRRRLASLNASLARLAARQATLDGVREGAGALLALAAPWAVLLVALPRVASGSLAPLLVVPLTLGITGAFEAVQPLAEGLQRWGRASRAGERVEAVLAREPRVRDPARPAPAPSGCTLEARALRFGFHDRPVIDAVDVRLAVGERTVLVGPSGSGKSTLLRLLARFADPQGGRVTLGGVDVRRLRQEELRARLAVVPQGVTLFHASVRANLAMAAPGADDARLWSALEQAELAEVVAGWPDGLDTLVGEQGGRLSGGERQRLAVARALLKDAPLLLLDEPTAHLDADTERRLLARLLRPGPDRGVLLVTHRLVGLEAADRILVMDGGRIVQQGGHRELAAAPGTYRRLLDAQHGRLGDADASPGPWGRPPEVPRDG